MSEGKQALNSLLKIPKDKELYEIATATCWIDENGIFCAASKPVRRSIEKYKEMIELFAKFSKNGSKLCFLIDLTNPMPLRNEVRDYLATEFPKYLKAHAVLVPAKLERTVATFFMQLDGPSYPINQFSEEKEAKLWLKQFMHPPFRIPDNTKLYETPIATFWLDEDGIVCATSKKVERSIAHFEKNMAVLAKLMKNGEKVLFLSDASDSMPMTAEIREYFANELPKYVKALAIISKVPLPGTLTTAVIKLSFTGFPINQFSTEEEAKEWLKTFL